MWGELLIRNQCAQPPFDFEQEMVIPVRPAQPDRNIPLLLLQIELQPVAKCLPMHMAEFCINDYCTEFGGQRMIVPARGLVPKSRDGPQTFEYRWTAKQRIPKAFLADVAVNFLWRRTHGPYSIPGAVIR